MTNRTSMEQWMEERSAPAVEHMLDLYHEIRARGLKVFLISSRREHLRDATIDNLVKVGYLGWTELILRFAVPISCKLSALMPYVLICSLFIYFLSHAIFIGFMSYWKVPSSPSICRSWMHSWPVFPYSFWITYKHLSSRTRSQWTSSFVLFITVFQSATNGCHLYDSGAQKTATIR